MNDKQVKSAKEILENYKSNKIEIILVYTKNGISVINFGFKKIVNNYSKAIMNIIMDSIYLSLLLAHLSLWIDWSAEKANTLDQI